MKKNHSLLIITTVLLFATVVSCKKDNDTVVTPLTAVQAKNVVADPTVNNNHYSFFSLERNEAVPYTDSATNKWDIAVRSTTILTNAGTSGPGLGGAFVQKSVSFDSYASIADSTFKTDVSSAPAYAIPTGSGNGWYNYNSTTNVISPIPGNIIIVRTATGKYAKLEILSYYKDAPTTPTSADVARYYAFRFVYQPNGTKKF